MFLAAQFKFCTSFWEFIVIDIGWRDFDAANLRAVMVFEITKVLDG